MKRPILPFFLLLCFFSQAQQTFWLTDPQATYKEAQELYQKQYYSLAYPIFKQLQQDESARPQLYQTFGFENIQYYNLVCSLNQDDSTAVAPAKIFIERDNNAARDEMLGFHLAEYEFRHGNYEAALKLYESSGIENLSNE
jgi:hypothetical protein